MPSSVASVMPGITPAMKRSPTEAVDTGSPFGPVALMPLVATEKITRLMEGGNRMPPARMKNGIAMISNLSRPVNSFSATEAVGSLVIVKKKLSTVRPRAIDTGMPVSINATRSVKMMSAFMSEPLRPPAVLDVQVLDVRDLVVRQRARAPERPHHLQEAEAHQVRGERNAGIGDPGRHLEVGRGRTFGEVADVQVQRVQERVVEAV